MTVDQPGGFTRREMIGIGGASALAGLAVAGLPLTAAAAPISNHVAAWGPVIKPLATPTANLTYLNIDGTLFQAQNEADYLDNLSGRGVADNDGRLIAPLPLPVGSVVSQINIGYLCPSGSDLSIQIFRRDFLSAGNVAWSAVATAVAPGGNGALTATLDFTPVTIEHGSSYTIQFRAALPATSVRGVTVGYVPPTAGFMPFAGSTPRVLDTRTGSTGKISANGEIVVDLGNPGVRGALLNVTVTDTEALGFAAVFQDGITWPGNSSVNWAAAGATVANGVVTAVAGTGRIKVRVGGLAAAKAHVLIDRLGWFV